MSRDLVVLPTRLTPQGHVIGKLGYRYNDMDPGVPRRGDGSGQNHRNRSRPAKVSGPVNFNRIS